MNYFSMIDGILTNGKNTTRDSFTGSGWSKLSELIGKCESGSEKVSTIWWLDY